MSNFASSEASIDWNGLLELGLLFSMDKSPVRDIIALEPIQPGPSCSPICCEKKHGNLQSPLKSEPSTLTDLLDLTVPMFNTGMPVPGSCTGVSVYNTGMPLSNTCIPVPVTNTFVPVFNTGMSVSDTGIPVPVPNTGVSVFNTGMSVYNTGKPVPVSDARDMPYLDSTSSACTSSQVAASLQPTLLVSSSENPHSLKPVANPQSGLAVLSEDPGDLRSRCNSGSSRSDRASGEDYRKRRERNNIAVRRSRQKAKERSQQKQEELKRLAQMNERLKKRCSVLEEEVKLLRSAYSLGHQQNPLILQKLRNIREKVQRSTGGDIA